MKKNKKGFTLIEILAVIIILVLLGGIAMSINTSLKSDLLDTEYDNLISLLELKAVDYANEYYVSAVSVQTLIDEGYVQADNDGFITSPTDGEILNCYLIEIINVDGSSTAFFRAYLGEDENGCKAYEYETDIGIFASKYNEDAIFKGVNVNNVTWYNDNLTLKVVFPSDINVDYDTIEYSWTNSSGLQSNDATVDIITDDDYESEFYVTVQYQLIGEEQINVLRLSKIIKIDKEAPDVDYYINDEDIWTQNKEVDIYALDHYGSGIEYVNVVSGETCLYDETIVISSFTVLTNGKYTICSKDYVGNIFEEVFEITNVDEIPPIVELTKSTDEIVSKLTLTATATDDPGSGVNKNSYAIITESDSCDGKNIYYSSENTLVITENGTYIACVKDNAGNIGNDEIIIKNIDAEAPTVEYEKNPETSTKSLTLSVKFNDNVGVTEYAISTTPCSSVSYTSITSTTSKEISKAITTNGTYYLCAKDESGNIASTTVTISNIDKTAPTVTYTKSTTATTSSLTLSTTFKDSIGVTSYAISTTSCSSASYTSITSSTSKTISKTITSNGTYYLCAKDRAGNVASTSVTISNVGTYYYRTRSKYECDCGYTYVWEYAGYADGLNCHECTYSGLWECYPIDMIPNNRCGGYRKTWTCSSTCYTSWSSWTTTKCSGSSSVCESKFA